MTAYLNTEEWEIDAQSGIRNAKGIITETAFNDDTQDGLLQLEDDSWWFIYRAGVIIGQMKKYFDKNVLTLDIGGGNGYTSGKAQECGFRMGIIEPSPEACRNAHRRGISEVNCGAVTESSVVDGSVGQMLLLDVLEHIRDDEEFLKLLRRKLSDSGKLLVTVPAFRCLWSSEDDAAGHFRRYRIRELNRLMKKSGFRICYRSYFMGFLFLPILFIRVFLEKFGIIKRQEERTESERRKIAKSQFKKRGGLVSAGLKLVQGIEKRLMRKPDRVPFGSSIIIVAKKK